jgi:hypothetical protein
VGTATSTVILGSLLEMPVVGVQSLGANAHAQGVTHPVIWIPDTRFGIPEHLRDLGDIEI